MLGLRKFNVFKIIYIVIATLGIIVWSTSVGYAKPVDESLVNITIPGQINVHQNSSGEINVDEFSVQNDSPIDFVIKQIDAKLYNNWKLVNETNLLQQDTKNICLSIVGNFINSGINNVDIPIAENNKSNLKMNVDMGVFTHKINEKAMDLTFIYNVVPTEFKISFMPIGNETFEDIVAFNGVKVKLPMPKNMKNFNGWQDIYTGKIYRDTMNMPIGGTKLRANYGKVVMSVEKFKRLPCIGEKFGSYKPITGLEFKTGITIPDDYPYWDISAKGDKSVIAYRISTEPRNPRFNDIVVAANADMLYWDGCVEYLFFDLDQKTPIKYVRSDGLKLYIMSNSLDNLFEGCHELVDISGLKYMETSNITRMRATFLLCKKLGDYSPIENWDTSNVTNMAFMFRYNGINNADFLRNWNVQNVEDVGNMFVDTPNLQSIDLGNWNLPHNCSTIDTFVRSGIRKGIAQNKIFADRFSRSTNYVKFTYPGENVNRNESININ